MMYECEEIRGIWIVKSDIIKERINIEKELLGHYEHVNKRLCNVNITINIVKYAIFLYVSIKKRENRNNIAEV